MSVLFCGWQIQGIGRRLRRRNERRKRSISNVKGCANSRFYFNAHHCNLRLTRFLFPTPPATPPALLSYQPPRPTPPPAAGPPSSPAPAKGQRARDANPVGANCPRQRHRSRRQCHCQRPFSCCSHPDCTHCPTSSKSVAVVLAVRQSEYDTIEMQNTVQCVQIFLE
jgi:hypothetical protein